MAIALPAIKTTLQHEGAPDYGVNDAILAEYLTKNKPFAPNTNQKSKAKTALNWAFKSKGFAKYQDQEVASFLFDTWVHSKTLYFVLVAFATDRVTIINEILHKLKHDDDIYSDINKHCMNQDDKQVFLAMLKFYRRRIERCYPRWANHAQKDTLFLGFDKRIASYPYTLECTPNTLALMEEKAKDMGYIIAKLGGAKNPSQFVDDNINYKLDIVQSGIWGIPDYMVVKDCKSPNFITTKKDDDNIGKTLAYGLLFLGITKLLKIW